MRGVRASRALIFGRVSGLEGSSEIEARTEDDARKIGEDADWRKWSAHKGGDYLGESAIVDVKGGEP